MNINPFSKHDDDDNPRNKLPINLLDYDLYRTTCNTESAMLRIS